MAKVVLESRAAVFSGAKRRPRALAVLAAVAALALLAWGAFTLFAPDVRGRYQAAYDAGDYDRAIALAEEAAAAEPDAVDPLGALAAAYLQKAYQNQDRANSAAQAARYAAAAVAEAPTYLDGWRALGAAQVLQGDAKAAAESYRQALALAPNDPNLLVQVGDTLIGSDPVQAGLYYGRALDAAPNDPLASLAAARAALAVGNYGRAEGLLQPALAGDVPAALRAEAQVTRADLATARGDGAAAEAAARAASELSPGNVDAKIALAEALLDGILKRGLTPDTTLAEARALAASAEAAAPTSARATFLAFELANAAGDVAGTRAAAARVRAAIPNDSTLSAAAREELSAQVDLIENLKFTPTRK